jgi:regulator of protease activity HflC (stomatin/prohibitin superfamily)
VNQKVSQTISDMVNICTSPSAVSEFASEEQDASAAQDGPETRQEGVPSRIYDPESPLMKKLSKKARTCHIAAPGILGHIVNPGCLSFYRLDGKTFAAPEGRWFLSSYKASWIARNVAIDQDQIVCGQALIIRVPPGAVGRIFDQGVPILLDVGTHVFNSGTVKNAGCVSYASTYYFGHVNFHYIRVPRGEYARVWAVAKNSSTKSVVPRLLAEGEHFSDSHLLKFDQMCNVDQEYIHHGSLHVVSVDKGIVAKVIQDNAPRLLGEGDHFIESPLFAYKGSESVIESQVIVHATMTLLRVTLGQIALTWKDSEPFFIDQPGLYEWDSPDFKFVEFKDAEESLIQLGSRKIVLVHTGTVGVTYNNGTLQILTNGRHVIDSYTHVFHRFLSTQQKSIRLSTQSASEKSMRVNQRQGFKKGGTPNSVPTYQPGQAHHVHSGGVPPLSDDSDLTICETKDLVKVGLRADVFYSIEDPEKCIKRIDTDELEDLVRETAVATLTNIIRSTALNEIAQSKQVSAGGLAGGLTVLPAPVGKDADKVGSSSMSAFFEKAHDEFLEKLHDDFMFRYGVDIANIRIESFKIMDDELSDQISKHALTTAQIENEMANLEGNSLISTTKERTAAEVLNINAKADAEALHTRASAENQRKIEAAQAASEAMLIQARAEAKAEAESILTKAKAEAEAIRLKADAEADRAEKLSRTKLGMQEALLGLYSNIVIESNKGVEKVIYMDPSINRESPFAIGSLQNLNYDLHSLSQLGVAAGQATGGNGNGKR